MRTRKGFSLAELMVALTLSGIVISGAYGLMRTQSRAYGKQLGTGDAAETLEGAGALLSWEIRHADMATDTLVSLSADTLSVRSVQGVGIICAKKDPGLYAIWKNGGDIQPTVDDTAMVSMLGNQAWTKAKITAVGTPVAMGLTACAWTGGRSRPRRPAYGQPGRLGEAHRRRNVSLVSTHAVRGISGRGALVAWSKGRQRRMGQDHRPAPIAHDRGRRSEIRVL